MLINGKWEGNGQMRKSMDSRGRFVCQGSVFRNWVTPDGSPGPTGVGGFKPGAQPGERSGEPPATSSDADDVHPCILYCHRVIRE